MEVTYTLEKSDYLRFGWFVIRRVPALKRQAILRFFGFPVLNVGIMYGYHFPLAIYLLNIFGFTILWVGYLWWAQQQLIIALARARTDSFGLQTVSLQPDGLYNQTAILDTHVKWQNIVEVADSPQMITLFISPQYGFIVPKRAFLTAEHAQAFLETVRVYRRSALEGTPAAVPTLPATWPPAPQRML